MIRIAVVGALVFDRVRGADGVEWTGLGGIAYSVGALAVLGGERVRIVPVCRVGEDHADRLRRLWDRTGNVEYEGVVVGPDPTPRVEAAHGLGPVGGDRRERLLEPSAPLTRRELEPALDADRILLNCITGFEIRRPAAEWLAEQGGPLHLDLHSLMLARGLDGTRSPRRPRGLEGWTSLAETLQCNGREAELAAGGRPIERWLEKQFAGGLRAAIVTRGGEGAMLYEPDGTSRVEAPEVRVLDATGAGDVLGAAWLLARAEGAATGPALRRAVAIASGSCELRGAEALPALIDGPSEDARPETPEGPRT